MAQGALLPAGYETVEDAAGATLPGAKIWTYISATSTPQNTYTDAALTVPNSNPIIADGAGRWRAYGPPGFTYRLVYQHPTTGATLFTVDNVTGPQFSGQLSFPPTQVPSNDPNTLDDYEEGNWTPVLGGAGGQSGQTYTIQVGQYIKVGRLVTVQFDVQLSAKGTIAGVVQVSGLPFSGTINGAGCVSYFTGWSANKVWVSVQAQVNALGVYGLNAAATGVSVFSTADVTDTLRLIGSCTYVTNS